MSGKKSLSRKILRKFLYVVYVGIAVLLLFEIAYRYQWIDFYSSEFEALNPKENPKKENSKTVLICGDSFTASPIGWVSELRTFYPDHRFVNCAIPGTGIRETRILAPDRVEEFQPDIFIYQIYVGNDLFDIKRPTNWSELSFMRNVFWSTSDWFLSLRLLNYKIGQVSHIATNDSIHDEAKSTQVFDPALYNPREKTYWKAKPGYFEEAIFLHKNALDAFEELKEGINEMKENLPSECKMYVMIIPHASQVNSSYFNQTKQIFDGFPILQNTEAEWTSKDDFPFQKKLRDDLDNVQFIDALSFLRKSSAESNEMIYFPNDPHLTSAGQHQISTLVAKEIVNDFQ